MCIRDSSVFHKTLRAISSEANVVMVGTPLANDLTVVLEGNYKGVKGTAAAAQLKAVIDAATGTTTTVAEVTFQGDAIA